MSAHAAEQSDTPIAVSVTRGALVESRHAVDAVVLDAKGGVALRMGDAARPVFPRSAVKAIQALPLIESGAADAFGLSDAELALACASHNGEPRHVDGAASILSRAGLEPVCLECGAQMPALWRDQSALAKRDAAPTALHNNCSGKHAGFLATAAHLGWDTKGYVGLEHPVQRRIAQVMTEVTGAAHEAANSGGDGCAIPTFAVPLTALALGFARFASGAGVPADRAAAMARLRAACAAHPEMTAGEDRACTGIMEALGARAYVKTGAEGVYTAALPETGLGIALKARDGATRAAETALIHLLDRFLTLSDVERAALEPWRVQRVKNRNGLQVGEVRVAP